MFKKILPIVFAAVLILSISAVPAMAAPYVDGGIKIGYGTSTIESVDFDTEDFNETSPSEAQWNLRTDMADVGGPQTEAGQSGYAGNIGWTSAGEWVQYTINVEVAGNYNFKAYLASGATPAGTISVSYDGNLIGQAESVNLGDPEPWQNYDMYNVGDVEMTVGTHVIKVDFVDGSVNFAALEVTALFEEPTSPPAADEVPEVQGEDDMTADGGENAATEITEAANSSDNKDDNNMILWIAVAAGAVLVIIIIAVLVTKKK